MYNLLAGRKTHFASLDVMNVRENNNWSRFSRSTGKQGNLRFDCWCAQRPFLLGLVGQGPIWYQQAGAWFVLGILWQRLLGVSGCDIVEFGDCFLAC